MNSSPQISSHAPALAELRGISKSYLTNVALRDVSLSIAPGVTGLLGPNGSGKSTLIKVLLGLVRFRGSGELLGFRLGWQAAKIREVCGYMPEDDCYLPGISGIDMMRFVSELAGMPASEGLRRSHEILDFCGIEQERYREVDTYSVGMRQQLKFAQAIVHDPKLLILDEPTSGLDPQQRLAMLNRIKTLAERAEKSVIISTHILPDVQATCENVIILADGAVKLVEKLSVLSKPVSPAIEIQLLGSAEPFIAQLESAGRTFRLEPTGVITVDDANQQTASEIFEWARAAGVGVKSLTPVRTSLEAIFLDAISTQDDAKPVL